MGERPTDQVPHRGIAKRNPLEEHTRRVGVRVGAGDCQLRGSTIAPRKRPSRTDHSICDGAFVYLIMCGHHAGVPHGTVHAASKRAHPVEVRGELRREILSKCVGVTLIDPGPDSDVAQRGLETLRQRVEVRIVMNALTGRVREIAVVLLAPCAELLGRR